MVLSNPRRLQVRLGPRSILILSWLKKRHWRTGKLERLGHGEGQSVHFCQHNTAQMCGSQRPRENLNSIQRNTFKIKQVRTHKDNQFSG